MVYYIYIILHNIIIYINYNTLQSYSIWLPNYYQLYYIAYIDQVDILLPNNSPILIVGTD